MPANVITNAGLAVSVLVAAVGYSMTQWQLKRSRLAKLFAEALRAVYDFKNYHFLVARRSKDTPRVS